MSTITSAASHSTTCHPYVPLSRFDWSFNRTGPIPWSPGVYSIIAVFTGLACWSTIHLTIRILFFFKRYRGLYFWSLIITTWALSIREIGFLMRWVAPHINWIFSLFLAETGWIGMVTGFSIVLWSRLSIIVSDRRILWGVLGMILTNGFIFHSALMILQYGLAASTKAQRGLWLKVLNPMERVQITMFTVQEVIISGFYMRATYRLLQDRIVHHADKTRKALILLFVVQTVVIMMDIVIITLDLAGYFTLKAIIHSWIYGIKLELEFVVLNQLVEIAKSGVPGLTTITDDSVPDITQTTQTGSSQSARSPVPSPNSTAPLTAKQEWWAPPQAETAASSRTSSKTRRQSLVHQSPSGLDLIPEGRVMDNNVLSFREMLGEGRALSLDRIGVIPDP